MANNNLSTAIEWSEIYDLGMPEIDAQHEGLFAQVNDIAQALEQAKSCADIASRLGRLEHSTIRHFCVEEALMRRISYPYFDAHRRGHLELIRHLAEKRQRQADGLAISPELPTFLCDWLTEHILTADRAYAEHYVRLSAPEGLIAGLFSYV